MERVTLPIRCPWVCPGKGFDDRIPATSHPTGGAEELVQMAIDVGRWRDYVNRESRAMARRCPEGTLTDSGGPLATALDSFGSLYEGIPRL